MANKNPKVVKEVELGRLPTEREKVDLEIPQVEEVDEEQSSPLKLSRNLKIVIGVCAVLTVVLATFLTGKVLHTILSRADQDNVANVDDSEEQKDADKDDSQGDGAVVGEGKPEEKPAEKPEEKPSEETSSEEPSQPVTPAMPTNPVMPSNTGGKKLVALTFDDGPSSATTPRLLEILRQKGVHATFFVVGNMAQKSPGLLQQEVAEGHEVGSHTPAHRNLSKMNAAGVRAEAEEMNRIFREILGKTPPFTRPPYGAYNEIARTNMMQPFILWTVDPEDWKYRNAATVRSRVTGAVFDGAIVLMHDIHATTVDAVANIIDDLRARGYEFLTVSEMAKVRGVTLENGGVYGSFRP